MTHRSSFSIIFDNYLYDFKFCYKCKKYTTFRSIKPLPFNGSPSTISLDSIVMECIECKGEKKDELW